MRNLISTLLFFTSLIVSSQNTTKVTFENKPILSANQLQGMTEDVQKIVLKQLQSTIVLSTMEVRGGIVYYQTKSQSQEKTDKGNGKFQNVGGKNSMLQDVTTTVEAPSKKILKNALKNTYTQLVEEKISIDEFEDMIAKVLKSIEESIYETLNLASVTPKDIKRVLLTGGTSQVPMINRLVVDIFDEEKVLRPDYFSSVATGLGYVASRLSGK